MYGESIVLKSRNEEIKKQLKWCGKNVCLNGKITMIAPENIHIEDNVHIGNNSYLDGRGGIFIDKNTHISRNFVAHSSNHNYEGIRLPYDEKYILKPIRIGKNVWIGTNVVLLSGVQIDEGAIIGAGSIVARNVEKLSIIGSQPFRKLKKRNAEHYEKLESIQSYGGISGRAIDHE